MKTIHLLPFFLFFMCSISVNSQIKNSIKASCDTVCGDVYELYAENYTTGTWTAFVNETELSPSPLYSPTYTDPNAVVTILNYTGAYIDVCFVWDDDTNNNDTLNVVFVRQPIANAGLDNQICGNQYNLGAVYDITGITGYTPSGWWEEYIIPVPEAHTDIVPEDNDTATATVTHYGIYEYVFREYNSNLISCYDTDTVTIEYVEIPIVYAGEDKDVCGTCVTLEGISAGFDGGWLPNGGAFDPDYDPTADVCVSGYGPYTFTWQESNQATTLGSTMACSAQDDVVITFWRVPTANILTDIADSTVCGLTFEGLRAEDPGSGINAYWYNINPSTSYDPSDMLVDPVVTVQSFGYYDFYWIEVTGPALYPDFCSDTAGPLTIHFIDTPESNAGGDTLFCGLNGYLSALPSVGTGVWTTPSTANISFENVNDPESYIESNIINTGNEVNPYFDIIWTEDNSNGCTDKDTLKVIFTRTSDADIYIIPPRCFGEPATIAAVEDSLHQYTWNFYDGIIDSICPPNVEGGYPEHFVYWTNEDTEHQVSLITTNYLNCQSVINIDTVYEPPIPIFDYIAISDTCMLGKGGFDFTGNGEMSFFWLNEEFGPESGTQVTTVNNIPSGSYDISMRYQGYNLLHYMYYIEIFGTSYCLDTIECEITNYSNLNIQCPNDTIINNNVIFYLDVCSPSGGIYTINGVAVEVFAPSLYEEGIHAVLYTYSDLETDCQDYCTFYIELNQNSTIADRISKNFTVYPNPNDGNFNVEFNIIDNYSQFKIYNMNGQVIEYGVIEKNGNTTKQISLNISPGVYYFQLISAKKTEIEKIIIY